MSTTYFALPAAIVTFVFASLVLLPWFDVRKTSTTPTSLAYRLSSISSDKSFIKHVTTSVQNLLTGFSPFGKHKTIASQDASPFFQKLPLELRRQIYVLVLGGNRHHIEFVLSTYKRTLSLRSAACRGTMALACPAVCPKGYRQYINDAIPPDWVAEQAAIAHGVTDNKDLRDHRFCTLPWSTEKPNTTALLRSCRAVYLEAKEVLYQDNIFAFDNAIHLGFFVSKFNPATLNDIKNIEIYVVSAATLYNLDGLVLCIRRMQGLRNVTIVSRHDIWDQPNQTNDKWAAVQRIVRAALGDVVTKRTMLRFESFEGRKRDKSNLEQLQ